MSSNSYQPNHLEGSEDHSPSCWKKTITTSSSKHATKSLKAKKYNIMGKFWFTYRIQLVEKLLIPGRISLEQQDHYQRNAQHFTVRMSTLKSGWNMRTIPERTSQEYQDLSASSKNRGRSPTSEQSRSRAPFGFFPLLVTLTRIYANEHGSTCNHETGVHPTDLRFQSVVRQKSINWCE